MDARHGRAPGAWWKLSGSVTSAGCSLPIRFSTFPHNKPTFFFFFFNPRPPQTSISGSHSLPTFTARKLRQQHSTLFRASPGVTDSKQHFSPPFYFLFHGKLLSLYNLGAWLTARPTIPLLLSFSNLSLIPARPAVGWKMAPGHSNYGPGTQTLLLLQLLLLRS